MKAERRQGEPRIACVSIIDDLHVLSGVFDKVGLQARAAREAGLDGMEFHVLTSGPDADPVENVRVHRIERSTSTLGKLDIETRALAAMLNTHDVVITRYLPACHIYLRNLRKMPGRLISEIHTQFLSERLLNKRYRLAALERLFVSPCLNLNDGIIALTDELARYVRRYGYRGAHLETITNGIAVEAINLTGFRPFDGKVLRLCLLASMNVPWHGIDRLARGLRSYRGEARIEVHVVGAFDRESLPEDTEEVRYCLHGICSGEKLDAIMARMTMGVSTLALHRKRMKEACSLKTREYMARGLPFIYAYHDPDLEAVPSARRFPADETDLPVDEIIAFAREMAEQSVVRDIARSMRFYASDRLDWKRKMLQYHELACRVNAGREN